MKAKGLLKPIWYAQSTEQSGVNGKKKGRAFRPAPKQEKSMKRSARLSAE